MTMHHIQYIIDVILEDEKDREITARMITDGEESKVVYKAGSFSDAIHRGVNCETFEYDGFQTLELSFKGTYDHFGVNNK